MWQDDDNEECEQYWYGEFDIGEHICKLHIGLSVFLKHASKIEWIKSTIKEDVLFIIKNLKEDHINCELLFGEFYAHLFVDFDENIISIDWLCENEGEFVGEGAFADHMTHYLSPFMKKTKMVVDPLSCNAYKYQYN